MRALAAAGANVRARCRTVTGYALELALEHEDNAVAQAVLEIESHEGCKTRRDCGHAGSNASIAAIISALRSAPGSAAERALIRVGASLMPPTHAAAFLGLPSALVLLHKRCGLELFGGTSPLGTAICAPLQRETCLATVGAALRVAPEWAKCVVLLELAIRHSSDCIVKLLLKGGASANASIGTQTPLVLAIERRHDLVDVLLQNGADPSLRDASGATPLMRAAGLSSGDSLVRKLCAAGARTAERYTGEIGSLRGFTAVGVAVAANNEKNCFLALEALHSCGASLDAPQGAPDVSPIWLAVDRKCERAAIALIELGAKTEGVVGPGGEALLSLAARKLPAVESRLRSGR